LTAHNVYRLFYDNPPDGVQDVFGRAAKVAGEDLPATSTRICLGLWRWLTSAPETGQTQ
jgi:hypothetical protein